MAGRKKLGQTPEYWKKKFPSLSDEDAAKVAKTKAGLLDSKQRERYLRWYSKGFTMQECLSKCKISASTYQATKLCVPDFQQAVTRIQKNKCRRVESAALRYATGEVVQIKYYYEALIDVAGNVQYDRNGKQKFICRKKEITKLPPNPYLIAFYLKAKEPEIWMDKSKSAEIVSLPTSEELKERLTVKMRELDVLDIIPTGGHVGRASAAYHYPNEVGAN